MTWPTMTPMTIVGHALNPPRIKHAKAIPAGGQIGAIPDVVELISRSEKTTPAAKREAKITWNSTDLADVT